MGQPSRRGISSIPILPTRVTRLLGSPVVAVDVAWAALHTIMWQEARMLLFRLLLLVGRVRVKQPRFVVNRKIMWECVGVVVRGLTIAYNKSAGPTTAA